MASNLKFDRDMEGIRKLIGRDELRAAIDQLPALLKGLDQSLEDELLKHSARVVGLEQYLRLEKLSREGSNAEPVIED